MKTAVERLAEVIGYPETVPGGAMAFAFTVSAPDERLRRLFEVFTASCDWWAERVKEALSPELFFQKW